MHVEYVHDSIYVPSRIYMTNPRGCTRHVRPGLCYPSLYRCQDNIVRSNVEEPWPRGMLTCVLSKVTSRDESLIASHDEICRNKNHINNVNASAILISN